jgi:hypothetical protein
VTDPSAPGTVQFYSGTTAIGSPATVSDGVASLTTSALPTGTDTLSAVFTPTTGAAFSGSTSNTVTYVVNTPPPPPAGGTVTLSKSTKLIGNYSDKVSGTGWNTHSDTSVTIYECATTTYSASSCDSANPATATVGTSGSTLGAFKNALIKVDVGTIDSNGDTCGLASSGACYIVVVGNSGDTSASTALGFTLPTFTVKKTTGVLGNYVDALKASGIPIGDTVDAQECDATVVVPTNVSTHCDASTEVSGTASTSGAVAFSPTGVTLRVGSAYSDTADGTVAFGGNADVAFTDADNAAIGTGIGVGFATPAITLKKTTAVLGNYVEGIKTTGFPIGDTIDATECNTNVSVPSTVSANCDAATEISGTVAANGAVAFSPTGVTLKVGGAYSDTADGTVAAGGNADIAVTDADNTAVALEGAVSFAAPTSTVKATTDVKANTVDKVAAADFPIGDTVDAFECDSAVTASNVGTNCDSGTEVTGTVASSGKVTFSEAGVTVVDGASYSDTAGNTVEPGGDADIVINDATHSGFFIAVPITIAG